jgi:hypothetical protein
MLLILGLSNLLRSEDDVAIRKRDMFKFWKYQQQIKIKFTKKLTTDYIHGVLLTIQFKFYWLLVY